MRPVRFALAFALIVAAQAAVADTTQTPAPDTCGMTALNKLIGQPFGGIDPMAVNGTIRIIYPGDTPPTDTNPQRTIVQVDKYDNIIKLSCG
jgi:hypothetical protein